MRTLLFALAAFAVAVPAIEVPVQAAPHALNSAFQSSDYYTNVRGHRVHRPVHARQAPRGATARCRDGTYSFSENHRGTCSHHGGVSSWL